MVFMKTSRYILFLLIVISSSLYSQEATMRNLDSTHEVDFSELKKPAARGTPTIPLNAIGIDLLVSANGFGLGTFYRHEYSDDLSGFVDFSISEAADEKEIEFIDPYTGQTFIPGKVNRFLLLPLLVGIQHRIFREDITDNFRPYINLAIGPTMIFVFPYDEEYLTAIGKGRPKYTFGGYAGVGAYFGSERSSLLGLNLRYYFLPYPGGLESMRNVYMKQFGGFFVTMSFGSTW